MSSQSLQSKVSSKVVNGVLSQITASQAVLHDLRSRELQEISDSALVALADANVALAKALSNITPYAEMKRIRQALPEDVAASLISANRNLRYYFQAFMEYVSKHPSESIKKLRVTTAELNETLPTLNCDLHRSSLVQFGVLERFGARCKFSYQLTDRGLNIARLLGFSVEGAKSKAAKRH